MDDPTGWRDTLQMAMTLGVPAVILLAAAWVLLPRVADVLASHAASAPIHAEAAKDTSKALTVIAESQSKQIEVTKSLAHAVDKLAESVRKQ